MDISIPHPLPVMKRSLFAVLTTFVAAKATTKLDFRNSSTNSNLDIFANCHRLNGLTTARQTLSKITSRILICHFSSDRINAIRLTEWCQHLLRPPLLLGS